MVVGGTYGLSLPLWGYLCDSQLSRNSPKFVEVLGALLIGSGFLVLGRFLPEIENSISVNNEKLFVFQDRLNIFHFTNLL